MKDCIFCKIIKGELPSYKIWEDENYLAFLSNMPINPGHTLVIPKSHTDYFFDLDNKTLGEVLVVSKPISEALKKTFNPKSDRIGVMIAGMGVPHAHLHLIPIDKEGDLTFARQKSASNKELEKNTEKIKTNLRAG